MKIKKKKISEFIENEYREYAVYSLASRAIPSFYDGLTNAQRFIINTATRKYNSCLKIVGDAKSAGYHHGNTSLEKTLNSLARPFLCSEPILEGDGFFGNPINQDPAASRYTSARISSRVLDAISKYKDLNERNMDGGWDLMHTEIPIGLFTLTTDIAVGYSCKILPRKLEHIESFFKGTRKNIKPYFIDYTGEIVKNKKKKSRSSWIIKPNIKHDISKKTITILDYSPTISYTKFTENLNKILNDYKCKVINNTRDKIDMTLKFNRNISEESFMDVVEQVVSKSTTIFTENIILVKDGSVLEYVSIEDYLKDFKNYREFLLKDKIEYDLSELESELKYLLARAEYLKFMLTKKRKDQEVEKFLKKYDSTIYNRLDSIKLRNLNTDYQKKTDSMIKDVKSEISSTKKEFNKQSKVCSKIKTVVKHAKFFSIK